MNLKTLEPANDNPVNLSVSVPLPDFTIGQRVTHDNKPGTVVGMIYHDTRAAAYYKGEPGWEYVFEPDAPKHQSDIHQFV